MNTDEPLQLLGGLTPATFMRRHWQKKPLLIRQAIPGFAPLLARAELLDLAAQDEVESRLVVQPGANGARPWRFRHGPFVRKALPAFKQPGWTLLVQGGDLLDAQKDLSLQPNMPLKILANFEPEMEFVLEPGDMLYLPPRYAHDGIAVGECMTYSIGFRAPSRAELTSELLQRLAEEALDAESVNLYRDPKQEAVAHSGAIPGALFEFAQTALADALRDPLALQRVLGEYLSEPKAHVRFDNGQVESLDGALVLDRRTRMLYDAQHIFLNGESFLATGREAQLMRHLADGRSLPASDKKRLSAPARELVADWCEAGWMYVEQ